MSEPIAITGLPLPQSLARGRAASPRPGIPSNWTGANPSYRLPVTHL